MKTETLVGLNVTKRFCIIGSESQFCAERTIVMIIEFDIIKPNFFSFK